MPAEVGGKETEIGTKSCISALPQNPGDLEHNSSSTGRQGARVALATGSQASVPAGLDAVRARSPRARTRGEVAPAEDPTEQAAK